MTTRGLDDLIALHEQLATLDESGVPLDLGVSSGRVRILVSQVGQQIADRVGRGESLREAVQSADTPSAYQRVAAAWLSDASLDSVLTCARRSVSLDTETRRLTAGLIYPVVVTVLACVGLAVMVSLVLPHIEAAYADMEKPVGRGIAGLQTVRATIPVWAVAVPVALVVGVFAAYRAKAPRATSKSRDVGVTARAQFARASHLAGDLLAAGVKPGEALQQAGVAAEPKPAQRLPAMLEWLRRSVTERPAAWDDAHTIGWLYDLMAKRGARRFATLTPALACIVVGGGATLVYAMALFVPLIEMLWAIAEQ
ncbi:MAG: type II secretion system F family protein [Planctomycetota bacterium]